MKWGTSDFALEFCVGRGHDYSNGLRVAMAKAWLLFWYLQEMILGHCMATHFVTVVLL